MIVGLDADVVLGVRARVDAHHVLPEANRAISALRASSD